MSRSGILFTLLFWALWPMLGCRSPEPEPPPQEIRIGVLLPFTGGSTTAEPAETVLRLRIDQIRQEGGLQVGGVRHPVRLIIVDDSDNPTTASEQARRLINEENVAAWIGSYFSRNAERTGAVAESLGVPMITPTASSPEVNTGREWVFRMTFTNQDQGRVLAQFAAERIGAQRAATLYDKTHRYNRAVAEHFQETFVALGGEIVASEGYLTGAQDWLEELQRIAQTKPDVLLLPNFGDDTSRQTLQARELGMDATLLGSDGWDGEGFEKREEFQGSYLVLDWCSVVEDPVSRKFIDLLDASGKRDAAGATAALSWDALNLLLQAIQDAKSLDRRAIRDALSQTKDYQGVTGTISFSADGAPAKSALVLKAEEGRWIIAAQIDP